MSLTLQLLTLAAAAIAVFLLLVRPWTNGLASLIALVASGLTSIGAALRVGEMQIALAWLSAVAVAALLQVTVDASNSATPGRAGPFRLLNLRRAAPLDTATGPGHAREWIFRSVVFVILVGAAAILASRAFAAGTIADPVLGWAALTMGAGGIAAAVMGDEPGLRTPALLTTLNGLAVALVLVDRDWGRALAIGVLMLIVALNGVAQASPERPTP